MYSIPWEPFRSSQEYDQLKEEFVKMTQPLYNTLTKQYYEETESSQYIENIRLALWSVFLQLKLLHFEELVEFIQNYIYHDPLLVKQIIDAISIITGNIFEPLGANQNLTIETTQCFNFKINQSKIKFPVEIGKYIIEKIVRTPNTYKGCIEAIEHYKDNDLYKLLESLDNGIKKKDKDRSINVQLANSIIIYRRIVLG